MWSLIANSGTSGPTFQPPVVTTFGPFSTAATAAAAKAILFAEQPLAPSISSVMHIAVATIEID
jgi:hypothetical protein